jgi:hypothetical protein
VPETQKSPVAMKSNPKIIIATLSNMRFRFVDMMTS